MRQLSREEKEMQGTYEPSREVESLRFDEWDGSKMPACPSGWPYPMQSFWNDRCKDLKSAGYLVKACIEPLRRYCWAVWQAREAEKSIMEEGYTIEQMGTKGQIYTVKNPMVDVLKDANREIAVWCSRFGFTPHDAQKIPAKVKDEGPSLSLLK